jgi:hypothetical protein
MQILRCSALIPQKTKSKTHSLIISSSITFLYTENRSFSYLEMCFTRNLQQIRYEEIIEFADNEGFESAQLDPLWYR